MSLQGFNLLRKQKTPPTAWEKIYSWVLGTARVIVIIVELVVVGSFVIRVIVDTQAKRLDKELESRDKTISSFAKSENRFREIQLKSDNYKGLWISSSTYSDMLKELDNQLSANFSNLTINASSEILTVRGAGDVSRISSFEDAIKQSTYFSNVETFEIDTSTGGDNRGNIGLRAVINDSDRTGLSVNESIEPSETNSIN